MYFTWPRPDQIVYRLYRLRRLLAVSAVLPILMLIITGQWGVWGLALTLGPIVAHVILFPNALSETLTMSVLIAALAFFWPLVPLAGVGGFAVVLVMLILGFFGFLALSAVSGVLLMAGPPTKKPVAASVLLKRPLEEARQYFGLRPNTALGRHICGNADVDGVFPVMIATTQSSGLDPMSPAMTISMGAKILCDEGPNYHAVEFEFDESGDALPETVTATRFEYLERPKGTLIRAQELPACFTRNMAFGFWMSDAFADSLTETADLVENRRARANNLAHRQSLLTLLGQMFMQRAMAHGDFDG